MWKHELLFGSLLSNVLAIFAIIHFWWTIYRKMSKKITKYKSDHNEMYEWYIRAKKVVTLNVQDQQSFETFLNSKI